MTEPPTADVYAADGYFVVIPEWILDCGLSSRAVHLYALLRRYSDLRTRMAHPSRRMLADALGVADEKSVDRPLAELAQVGAIRIRSRYGNGTRARVQDGPSAEFPQRAANAYFLLARRHPERHYPTPSDTADVTESDNGGGGGIFAPPPPASQGADQGGRGRGGGGTPSPALGDNGGGWGHSDPPGGAQNGEVLRPKQVPKDSSSSADDGAPETTSSNGKGGGGAEAFPVFWQTYPRKVGKAAAEKAFAKAVKAAGSAEAVLAGLERASFPADRQYVPHPTTWLNQGRWADEPEPAPVPAKEARPWESTTADERPAKERRPWEQ